jgi:hypothetical protein
MDGGVALRKSVIITWRAFFNCLHNAGYSAYQLSLEGSAVDCNLGRASTLPAAHLWQPFGNQKPKASPIC